MAETTGLTLLDPKIVFKEARDSFVSSLSGVEKTRFEQLCKSSTPENVLDCCKNLKRPSSQHGRLLANLSTFLDRLRPYFRIVGIFVSAHPEWAAVAWGALSLVLQGDAASERLKLSIAVFYEDLFFLYCSIAKVFTTKGGTIKRTSQVISSLMWRPFEDKFLHVTESMQRHQNIVKTELDLLGLQRIVAAHRASSIHTTAIRQLHDDLRQSRTETREVKDAIDALHKHAREESELMKADLTPRLAATMETRDIAKIHYGDVLKFIDPPVFSEEFYRLVSRREQGTGDWLFRNPQYLLWRENHEQAALWIKGKPGCGKSVLAAMITESLLKSKKSSSPNRSFVAHFFFNASAPGMDSISCAARALYAQLLHDDRDDDIIQSALGYALARNGGQQDEMEKFLNELYDCLATSNGKLLILSRPSVSTITRLTTKKSTPMIHISTELNSGDIRQYCRLRMQNLLSEHLLPATAYNDVEDLVNCMVTGTNGMFLWARLMFSYLRSPAIAPPHIAPVVRLRHIRDLHYPESLDQVYCRILNLIGYSDTYQRGLARQVFSWLLFGKATYLKALALHDILTVSYYSQTSNAAPAGLIPRQPLTDYFEAFDETILLACSNLVERCKTPTGSHYYRFIHKSVMDFFMYRFDSPTTRGPNGLHNSAMLDGLSSFLNEGVLILCWIEAVFLFSAVAGFKHSIARIDTWALWARETQSDADLPNLTDVSNNLDAFASDLRRLENDWGETLQLSPQNIWDDITALCQGRFWWKTGAVDYESLAPAAPQGWSQALKPLTTVSASDLEVSKLATVSVWPTPEFEETWSRVTVTGDLALLSRVSSGWVARYQLWDISNDQATAITDLLLPLESLDVLVHLQHFIRVIGTHKGVLNHSPYWRKGDWELTFPSSVNNKQLDMFVVLRTLYIIRPVQKPSGGPYYASYKIPIIAIPGQGLEKVWSVPLATPCAFTSLKDRPLPYTYGLEFSDCGRYLLYHDTKDMSCVPWEGNDIASILAVFHIPESKTAAGSLLTRPIGALHRKRLYFNGWRFHPFLPIMAIHTFDGSIVLWDFGSKRDEDGEEASRVSPMSIILPERSASALSALETMSFSDCGTQLIVKFDGNPLVKVVPIDTNEMYKAAVSSKTTKETTTSQSTEVSG
ncbi:hypothetical protein F4778DRAFT_777420 [Xylariomycetidae sp. FL2044]|nr:hypothetical protein F4778DRAFT_777420 [Xylariomycetidae sp. FL2044]